MRIFAAIVVSRVKHGTDRTDRIDGTDRTDRTPGTDTINIQT